ncbi:sulfatase [Blastopirellula sp. JC732]|uniref:Sulfatase n=1 Tax=Blastopirellula sediminis TaxID=2894196 RepID=A0A9X1SJL4_9BACT|nr:sulfatase [Blastopirellula sediminis]MCC9604575.1 sulfatase [Blastopirellula sediminis]MCC9632126.1 sulfatase [Blastopirellula sediminis]
MSRPALLVIALFGSLLATNLFADQRPNILFCISDDQSWLDTSIAGSKVAATPTFDQIARRGAYFKNAISASPGCSPSRAALLTGRYPWMIEEAGTHASSFPQKYVVYPDLLEKAGYFVGFTGKGWGPGDFKVSGRTRNPAGPAYQKRKLKKKPAAGISNNDYAANFADFLADRPADAPFCFWFGAMEPHRPYQLGSGEEAGKKLADATLPPFLPDADPVRGDLLDYCREIEWFDQQLGAMLKQLEEIGQLDNTIVVITSDNGMPFPRAKANNYEYGVHMPLAIAWPAKITAGQTIEEPVSLVDLAPTFLAAAGIAPAADSPMVGRNLLPRLTGEQKQLTGGAYSSRERHSSSRWNNLTYPQRSLRTEQYLLIRNFQPQRWPAGAPQVYEKKGVLGPIHGGYHDIDASPTLDWMVKNREEAAVAPLFHAAVDIRPGIELFDIEKDPGCLHDLAEDPTYAKTRESLEKTLDDYLAKTGDPRVSGSGDVWESYPRYSPIRDFPKPDWAK